MTAVRKRSEAPNRITGIKRSAPKRKLFPVELRRKRKLLVWSETKFNKAKEMLAQGYHVKIAAAVVELEPEQLMERLKLEALGQAPAQPEPAAPVDPPEEPRGTELEQALMRAFGLTHRQAQVAVCLKLGLSNEETAKACGIGIKGVKDMVTKVLKKAGVRTRYELQVKPPLSQDGVSVLGAAAGQGGSK